MIKQTKDEFIKKSKNIFGNRYDYSLVEYKNSTTDVVLICKNHGEFKVKPGPHLSYKRGCKYCKGYYTKKTFIERAKTNYGDLYDYSKVKFKNVKNKVEIVCKKHGSFFQTPDKHINAKQGCPSCNKTLMCLNSFIKKSKTTHGNKYSYDKSIFIGAFKNIEITCKKHGAFFQTPANHANHKTGCPTCYLESKPFTQEYFIKKCIKKHGNRYDYSNVKYKNSSEKISIICKVHGSFLQIANSHMFGANCPKCAGNISKVQEEWLDSINICKSKRNKVIKHGNKRYSVDALNEDTNTIYEFYGDYWHGNPEVYNPNHKNKHNKKRFKYLFDKTINRELELKKLGYNIVSIWEIDFKRERRLS